MVRYCIARGFLVALCTVTTCMATTSSGNPSLPHLAAPDYDAIIAAAHIRGAANLATRLRQWRAPFTNVSGSIEGAIAAFVLNDNATEVKLASDYLGVKSSAIGGFAMCEWSRAVALSAKVGTPSAAADKMVKDNALVFVSENAQRYASDATGDRMRQWSSENLDMVRRQTTFILAQVRTIPSSLCLPSTKTEHDPGKNHQ